MCRNIRKARKKTQNLPHCGSSFWQIVAGCAYYFGDFGKERDVTEGTLVRGAQDAQGDVRVLYSSNTTKIDTSMPYSENMSKTEDWGRNLTAGASGGSVYGCQ